MHAFGVPHRFARATAYSFLLWGLGFVWSMVVFAVPTLWSVRAIPGLSKHPPITVVLLPLYIVLVYLLARRHLRAARGGAAEGRRLGLYFALTNGALDLVVYFGLFGATDYFAYASIWIAYALLLAIPWALGIEGREHTMQPVKLSSWLAVFAFAIALALPTTSLAAEVRNGDTVQIGPNETINDDVYAFGNNILIQGTVNGDVIAAGSNVTIDGHVTGDVMAAGSAVYINGAVDGTVRAAGSTMSIAGPVSGDVLMGGANMMLTSNARVGRDLLAGGAAVNLQAPVGRDVKTAGASLTIGSSVGRAVEARVDELTIGSGAQIAGPLSYTSNRDATIAPTASIAGAIERIPPATQPVSPWMVAGIDTLGFLRGLVGLGVLGVLLVLVFPRATIAATKTVQHRALGSLGLGFALMVGMPMVAVSVFVLGLLIGGWWIGLMLLGIGAMMLLLGYLAAAEWMGSAIAGWAHWTLQPAWTLLIGVLVLEVLTLVPVIGPLVGLAAVLIGSGALVLSAWAAYHTPGAPTASAPTFQPSAATPAPLATPA